MIPAQRDLAIYRGDSYSHRIVFTTDDSPASAFDVSDYEFAAQVRPYPLADAVESFTIDDSEAADGILVLSLTATQTRSIANLGTSAVWDLQATDDDLISTWLAGTVDLSGDVTRV